MKIYLFVFFMIVLYAASVFFDSMKSYEDKNIIMKNIHLSSLENKNILKKNIYIFKNTAWKIFKKEKKKKKDIINSKQEVSNVKYYLNKHPMEICEGKDCFLFLAIEDNKAVFMKKNLQKDTFLRFVHLVENEKLTNRLILKKVDTQSIVLYDNVLKDYKIIKMFDVNISKYESKVNKKENYENK